MGSISIQSKLDVLYSAIVSISVFGLAIGQFQDRDGKYTVGLKAVGLSTG